MAGCCALENDSDNRGVIPGIESDQERGLDAIRGVAMVTGNCFCVAAGKPIVVRSDKIIIRIMEFDHRIAQRIGNAEAGKGEGQTPNNQLRRLRSLNDETADKNIVAGIGRAAGGKIHQHRIIRNRMIGRAGAVNCGRAINIILRQSIEITHQLNS